MASRDEVLQFIIKTQGTKDVEKVADSFDTVKKAADNADPAAKKLIDDLERLGKEKGAVGSFVKLKAQLTETRDRLTQATAGLEALRKEFGNAGGSSKQVTAQFKKAEQAIADLTKAEKAQSVEFQKASGALAKAGVDANKLADADKRLNAEISATSKSLVDFAARAGAAGVATTAAAAAAAALTKETKGAGASTASLGEQLGKIAVLAAAVGAAFKAVQIGGNAFAGAAGIEASLSRVQALAEGASEEFARLGAAVQEASREAKVGPEVAAQALAELAGQGQSAREAMEALVPTLRLAKIANIEVAQAAGLVDDTLDQFSLSTAQAAHVVDILVAASKGADEGLSGLSGAFAKVAPAARELGLSFEQTAAIFAIFVQNGFSAEKAAKGLLTIFTDLADPTSKLRDELRELGDNSGDFETAIKTIANAGDKGKEALLGLDTSARNLILFLIQRGPGAIGDFTKALSNVEGTASRVSELLDKNLKGAFKNAGDAFDRLATSFVTPLLEPLRQQIEQVAKAFDEFAATPAFKRLQDALVSFVTTGIRGLQDFIKTIDFKAVGDRLATFGTDAKTFFDKFRDDLAAVARFAGTTINGVAVLFDGAAIVIHSAATAVAASIGTLLKAVSYIEKANLLDRTMAALSGTASEAERLQAAGDALYASTRTNYDQTGKAAAGLAENLAALLAGLDGTKPAADAAGASIAGVGTAAGAVAPHAQGAAMAMQGLNAELANTPANANATADSISRFNFEIAKIGGGPIQDAKQRLQEASRAFAELVKAGNATPEALAKANAEFVAASRNLDKVTAAAKSNKAAADALAQSYKDLGIVSQVDLDETASKRVVALDAVTAAYRRGAATVEDVRRAFIAMAEAQLAAVRDSDANTRQRVENEIRVRAAALGVVDALEKLGLAGEKATAVVAAGADSATAALGNLKAITEETAEGAGKLAENAGSAGTTLATIEQNAGGAALALAGLNGEFANTASGLGGLDRVAFARAAEQLKQFQAELEATRATNAANDEKLQKLIELKNQYDLIDDSLLQQLQHEREIAEQQRQRAEQARQQAREQQQSTSNGGGSGGGRGTLDVNVTVKDDRAGATSLVEATKNRELAKLLARNLIPAIEDLVRTGMPLRIARGVQ